MLPKEIRRKQQKAKKQLSDARRILNEMERYINSSNTSKIEAAAAFFHVLQHHIEFGDLEPTSVYLTSYLRKDLTN